MPQQSRLVDERKVYLDERNAFLNEWRSHLDQRQAHLDQRQAHLDQRQAQLDQRQAHLDLRQAHLERLQVHDSTVSPAPEMSRRAQLRDLVSKVPAVTLGFWAVKVLATTLGETGGDSLSMSMGLGYLTSTLILAVVFVGAVALQVRTARFNQWLYWFTIIATTTLGTTIADFVDRSLGIGYLGGTVILVAGLLASLGLWYRSTGTIAVTSVQTPRAEAFYWLTIMFSQTLGTALGDWTADTIGLEYTGGALLFLALLAALAGLYRWTQVSRTLLFWAAFVLTRPLGAVVGDFLDKPIDEGGLALNRYAASAVLLAAVVAILFGTRQRAAEAPH